MIYSIGSNIILTVMIIKLSSNALVISMFSSDFMGKKYSRTTYTISVNNELTWSIYSSFKPKYKIIIALFYDPLIELAKFQSFLRLYAIHMLLLECHKY
jgi:hypothetical protein